MKVLKLAVNSFRSLREIEWNPGSLNVLIGPNASGKSNLMRSLEFIAAGASGTLGASIQDSGGMSAITWDNLKNASISFRLKTSPLRSIGNVEEEALAYELTLGRLGEGSSYRINSELLSKGRFANEVGSIGNPFKFLERRGHTAHIFNPNRREDGRALGLVRLPDDAITDEETVLSVAGNPVVSELILQNRVLSAYRQELAAWSIYHAFGSHPESQIRKPLVVRHEKRVSPDGSNLVSVLQTLYTSTREFRERIDDAMKAAFPDCYEHLLFQPVADQRVQLAIQFSGLSHPTSAAGLSDGTLRFLFLLTVLGSPEAASLIAVDEPEIGLHPSMLSIIAEFAIEASRRSQIIISTHSESFLNAFTETRPTTTIVKWSNGETHLDTLPEEQLADWLKGYSLGSLFASGELENMR
jgi:predicted ATPase